MAEEKHLLHDKSDVPGSADAAGFEKTNLYKQPRQALSSVTANLVTAKVVTAKVTTAKFSNSIALCHLLTVAIALTAGSVANADCLASQAESDVKLHDEQRLIVVAENGSDTASGSADDPLQTLKKATQLAEPGDFVMLRGGIYRQAPEIYQSGLPGQPITIGSWPGELAILDGTDIPLPKHRGLLQINATDLLVQNIEVRNSSSRGISVYDSERVVLRRSHVHHTQGQGYTGSGSALTVEDNRFHDLALINRDNGTPPWPSGVSFWSRANDTASSDILVQRNRIDRVWGECVGTVHSQNVQILQNRISNCYSVGIYLDNTVAARVERNEVYSDGDEFNRHDNGRGMVGIHMAVEQYDHMRSAAIDDIVIANNLLAFVDRGIGFFDDRSNRDLDNSYSGVTIAHNVVCHSHHAAVRFPAIRGRTPTNNRLSNNHYCKDLPRPAQELELGQVAAWTVIDNLAISPPFLPANASVASKEKTAMDKGIADVAIADKDTAITNKANADTTRTTTDAGRFGTRLHHYMLADDAPQPPHRGETVVGANIEFDAFCNPRPANRPASGLYEPSL